MIGGFPAQFQARATYAKMPLTTTGKWTVLYAVVAMEFAAIVATWRLWDNLNTRPGYRKWMYHKHPRVMDAFYWSCELIGVPDARERDLKDWNMLEPPKRTP